MKVLHEYAFQISWCAPCRWIKVLFIFLSKHLLIGQCIWCHYFGRDSSFSWPASSQLDEYEDLCWHRSALICVLFVQDIDVAWIQIWPIPNLHLSMGLAQLKYDPIRPNLIQQQLIFKSKTNKQIKALWFWLQPWLTFILDWIPISNSTTSIYVWIRKKSKSFIPFPRISTLW